MDFLLFPASTGAVRRRSNFWTGPTRVGQSDLPLLPKLRYALLGSIGPVQQLAHASTLTDPGHPVKGVPFATNGNFHRHRRLFSANNKRMKSKWNCCLC